MEAVYTHDVPEGRVYYMRQLIRIQGQPPRLELVTKLAEPTHQPGRIDTLVDDQCPQPKTRRALKELTVLAEELSKGLV